MGLFDTIHCEYPLPNPRHQRLEFQTKSLGSLLDDYVITQDGRLVRQARRAGGRLDRPVDVPIHGDVAIYTHEDEEYRVWVEYLVRFTHGRVEWIRRIEEARQAGEVVDVDRELPLGSSEDAEREAEDRPATPPGEAMGGADERALLASLGRDRLELEALLRECSDHRGYEDPVYRFYHQSLKVYGVQQRTQAIVERLQALLPDRPLNRWFLDLVEAGSGRAFEPEDNARWTERTRPLLEAFFHARFFLEMAVRYAGLDTPPQSLPSGYAALLSLFGLR